MYKYIEKCYHWFISNLFSLSLFFNKGEKKTTCVKSKICVSFSLKNLCYIYLVVYYKIKWNSIHSDSIFMQITLIKMSNIVFKAITEQKIVNLPLKHSVFDGAE